MPRRKLISQREARRLAQRVAELERREQERLRQYSRDYPGGVHVATIALSDFQRGRLSASQMLGAALVARVNGSDIYVYAVLPEAEP